EGVTYMAESLNLDVRQPIRTFSKGMKRQAFLILALCAGTKYLLCDEVFDGLDPIAAEVMKNLFRDRKSTRLNSSHVSISYAVFCYLRVLHSFPTRRSSDLRV